MFNEKAYREMIDEAINKGGISYKEMADGLKATTGTTFPNGNFTDYTGLYWKRFPNRKWLPDDLQYV